MRDPIRTTACVIALAVALGTAGPASADPDDARSDRGGVGAPYDVELPSRAQVRDAEERADRTAGDVARIRAALLLANQRLERAGIAAEQASEAYNGARWRLEQAEAAVARARADAARARREMAAQRNAIGALVASSYQQGAELTALNALMSADGPEGVLDQYVAFQGASTSLEADYQRFAATDALARVFARKAVAAQQRQRRVAAEAEALREQAVAAADAAQSEALAIAEEKDRLIGELARAQGISVSLAHKRQAALEEIARRRAEERARQEALAAARAEARAQREAAKQAAAEAAAEKAAAEKAAAEKAAAEKAAAEKAAAEQDAADKAVADKTAADAAAAQAQGEHRPQAPSSAPDPGPAQPAPRPDPVPAPQPPPPPPAPAPPAGGAQAAIAFATSQVGDPYRWGAAGPDAWDCSGLTMAAWRAGGISLPHYSVAQYHAGTPLTAGQLQPGDLVFWSSSSSPQGIHHVALYLGDGRIVHAPRTGRPVVVESMYSWVPPTHFARP